MPDLAEIQRLLTQCSADDRRTVFLWLLASEVIHPMETKLNTRAQIVLEALSRASDLTLRGIRGIIAEAVFAIEVAQRLDGWKSLSPPGNPAYDVVLEDGISQVRI